MKVLLIEDDEALASGLAELVRLAGFTVKVALNGSQARGEMAYADVVVTDLKLPDADGLDLVSEARAARPDAAVLVMTGHGTIASAVEAMRRGARAYLTKPFDPEEMLLHLRELARVMQFQAQSVAAGRGELVGASSEMRRVYAEIDLAASSDSPVLISGETGTGKELAARAIHALSRRAPGPLLSVNISSLPRELVESELFGHEKGAYTGAQARRRGRFLLARGGSLFLDELNSLPAEIQPKLLRVIETGELWTVGAEQAEKHDARVLSAANVPLEELVRSGRFREDLFYRLAVFQVRLPPLRERTDDIPLLVRSLLERAREADGHRFSVAPEAIADLMVRPWPGNVRELSNLLERARARAVGSESSRIEPIHLDPIGGRPQVPFKEARAAEADAWSKRTIEAALVRSGGNVSRAAEALRMNRNALFRLIRRYEIDARLLRPFAAPEEEAP